MALQKGDVVDRYRLEELLGSGAFGEVWKANQLVDGESIGVTCAVKVMRLAHERTGSSPRTFAAGWLDEVRNLVRVTDDTIPRIHEANVWNEHAYIAMELLDGTTLAARLAHGPIPWRRALFIADQIARALDAAHQFGVIHRDLKPQNVMLAGPKRVCVIDWGIARLSTSTRTTVSGVARQPTSASEVTDGIPVAAILTPHSQRVAVGTPGYMAPEVYEGARPTPEQDVYALGVVLYEMIAGCLPHAVEAIHRSTASSDSMKVYRVSLDKATMDHALVPLRERCPGTPRGVIELVDSLLARDPERRPRRLRDAIEHANRFPHGVPDPPYAGLSTLGLQHAGLYFGQQDTIQRVLERLRSQRGALLWGPSGAGKSSLALAGVAATMDRTLFLDMDGWDIHVIRPREGQGFQVVSDVTPSRRRVIGQVVIIDQLEEVVDLEPAARAMFCAAVLALLQGSAPVLVRDTVISTTDQVKLVATIRDDLEWRVDREVPELRPLLERRIIVKGVDANFARSIIEEPARALGYDVDGIEAVSREVEERLSSDPAKLPVIQYALSEWWERRDEWSRTLPVVAWNELGGVDGALSFVAERFFSALDHGDASRVKALLVRLFHGGRKQPLAESGLVRRDRLMMERLTGLRLVGRREKQGTGPFYEAEHEYLSENWTRLAGWLAEARDDRALAEELERDATAYLRDRDPERLWRKGRLAAAVDMAKSGRIVLNASTKQFLQQAERKERRGRLVLRAVIGVAVILAVVFAVVYAQFRANTATMAAKRASKAEARATTADANVKEAETKRKEAEARATTADARAMTADAKARAAEARAKAAEATATTAEEKVKAAEAKATTAYAKLNATEEMATTAEDQLEVAKARVTTDAAQLEVAEARATTAEARATTAEARATTAEARATTAETKRKDAEARATTAEARATTAEAKLNAAEEMATTAAAQLEVAEARTTTVEARVKACEASMKRASPP